jgi:hypothetical protein
MKRYGVIFSIFAIISAVYATISLLLTNDKNDVFWVGFGLILFSIVLVAIITGVSTKKKTSAFPLDISIITFSSTYILAVLGINVLFGNIFNSEMKVFVSVHILCFAFYAITVLILFVAKGGIVKQNNAVNGKICEMQVLIYDFEKIKSKLIDMNNDSRKYAMQLIDSVLEDLRFSDFGLNVDVSDIDNKLRNMADILSTEVDNLISIGSTDLSSMESSVNDIKKIVKDRNMQIRIMNGNV